jgi:hypothetical protein
LDYWTTITVIILTTNNTLGDNLTVIFETCYFRNVFRVFESWNPIITLGSNGIGMKRYITFESGRGLTVGYLDPTITLQFNQLQ